jgi:hypothetical protein
MAEDSFRSLIGSLKALPSTNRRLLRIEDEVRRVHARLDDIESTVTRVIAEADPDETLDLVSSVRDDLRAAVIELTDRADSFTDQG